MCENVTSLNNLIEVKISGFRAKITERVAVTEGKGQNSSPGGRQESAFSGKQMGLVQKGTLVVFYICMPRDIERHQRMERITQEYPASHQPLITSEGEKVKGNHPLLYRREKDGLTTNARKDQRPDLRLELKFLVYREARC